ncbi:Hypothetical protein NGAL_HAMBI2427_50080 [Neorhizobium galegae bv. orientalis]|uniref:Uncharacterized protein n=1 Tax=Neorhizobium galegae bv. orientalis str. HAMBI 540 TaxID=1028800 RepID=A0A068T0U3_NEOGA|nr:Hypothetical protein RG540_PA13370 [Neorhizobium galegae bv. orientalis str. HAMBI 540]CDZ53149.1 Hypothetical protein NGAL_HAMBI2427_50080 [Neorhizobium galegae bv. orientalis]
MPFDLVQLAQLEFELGFEWEAFIQTRCVGGKATFRIGEANAMALSLLFKPAKRVLEPRDGTDRRRCYGQVDLVVATCALKQRVVAVAILAKPFAMVCV